jgi:hypothetical protein
VRSSNYAGGASIRFSWTDGPTADQVKAISDKFEGGYFDGMIDYKGCRYHELDGAPVRFGADFIFAERTQSDALMQRAIDGLRDRYPGNFSYLADKGVEVTVEKCKAGELYSVDFYAGTGGASPTNSVQSVVMNAAAKRTTWAGPKPSATLARVKFAGDDGYGGNTVGTKDHPGGARGYPSCDRVNLLGMAS